MQIWALVRIVRLKNSPAKGLQKNGDKSAVAMLRSTRQLGCVSQDLEPPKSSSILRKSSDIRKPIRCVQFIKAVVRHANIRDHRLEGFAQVILNSVTPMLQNLRIGLRKRRNGKSDVPVKQRRGWRKVFKKLRRTKKKTFFSPPENWCLPAPSTLKPEEREFVVDSGASMYRISKKRLESC